MSEYYLVGNLDTGEDLWLISKKHGRASPVPKDVWMEIVSLFQVDKDEITSFSPDNEPVRNKHASDVLGAVDGDNQVNRNVALSLSTAELGSIVVNVRLLPLQVLAEDKHPLIELLDGHVTFDIDE